MIVILGVVAAIFLAAKARGWKPSWEDKAKPMHFPFHGSRGDILYHPDGREVVLVQNTKIQSLEDFQETFARTA